MSSTNARVLVLIGVIGIWLAATASSAQTKASAANSDLAAYNGVWEGKFNGKTFVTLKMKVAEGKLTGTVSETHIEVNQDGELTQAEQGSSEDPIVEARLDDNLLQLTVRADTDTNGQDSRDTVTLQMTLTGRTTAELRVITPPGIPATKPWKIERTAATA